MTDDWTDNKCTARGKWRVSERERLRKQETERHFREKMAKAVKETLIEKRISSWEVMICGRP